MIDEHLAETAALYATGALAADERDTFELVLEFHTELAAHVAGLLEVASAVSTSGGPGKIGAPSAALKARVLAAIADRPQHHSPGIVVSGPDRRVQWVNDTFSQMCGYQLEEIRGKSLGPLLQGEKTDLAVAERMRQAVHACQPCHETILNYHKDGTPYWVEIDIRPFRDAQGEVRWLVARECEMRDQPVAA